jgi:hypothetical protein
MATKIEQNNNRRQSKTSVLFRGENMAQASRRLGGDRTLVVNRIKKHNWDIEKAFTTKKRGKI